jgi:hypothetical protein
MEWILKRLEQLRADHATGHSQLVELSRREAELRDSVLRVEGAIRVLEEQLALDPAFAAAVTAE